MPRDRPRASRTSCWSSGRRKPNSCILTRLSDSPGDPERPSAWSTIHSKRRRARCDTQSPDRAARSPRDHGVADRTSPASWELRSPLSRASATMTASPVDSLGSVSARQKRRSSTSSATPSRRFRRSSLRGRPGGQAQARGREMRCSPGTGQLDARGWGQVRRRAAPEEKARSLTVSGVRPKGQVVELQGRLPAEDRYASGGQRDAQRGSEMALPRTGPVPVLGLDEDAGTDPDELCRGGPGHCWRRCRGGHDSSPAPPAAMSRARPRRGGRPRWCRRLWRGGAPRRPPRHHPHTTTRNATTRRPPPVRRQKSCRSGQFAVIMSANCQKKREKRGMGNGQPHPIPTRRAAAGLCGAGRRPAGTAAVRGGGPPRAPGRRPPAVDARRRRAGPRRPAPAPPR
jgi:hypothetical protein